MTGERSKDDCMSAVTQHLALVRASYVFKATGDDSALRTWHQVYGSVVLDTPDMPMSDSRWLTLIGMEMGDLRGREMTGAALVTQALASRYAEAVGRSVPDVLSEVEERLRSHLGRSG